jgi:membrane protein
LAIVKRAAKEMSDDDMTMYGKALAYSSFFAIPSVLLLAIGLFTLLAGPATITNVINHVGGVMPGQAKTLLSGSVQRLGHEQRSSLVMVIVGAVLAVWSTTGAMTTYMAALNVPTTAETSATSW